jgi:putative hydrolase of the HAD superfamily
MVSAGGRRILLSDIGGILVGFSWERAISHWAAASATDAETIRGRFAIDDQFELFETGSLTSAAYFAHLRQTLHVAVSDGELTAGWNAIFTGVDGEVKQLLEESRTSGVRVIGVTNTNTVHLTAWWPWYQAEFPVFDAVYASPEIGCRKPDRAFFDYVLRVEGVGVEDDVVFVDDVAENVDGASRAGIPGFVYHNVEQMRMQLHDRGFIPAGGLRHA